MSNEKENNNTVEAFFNGALKGVLAGAVCVALLALIGWMIVTVFY